MRSNISANPSADSVNPSADSSADASADSSAHAGTGPRLVLATRNVGKLRELRELLRDKIPGLNVDTQVIDAEAAGVPDVAETGLTFEANSLLKAHAVAQATGLVAVADDSGLAVGVLGGAPGIFSARWSGRHGDDAANLQLLLGQLSDIAPGDRGAAFVCAASVVSGAREWVETAELQGELLMEPRGVGGFGYDPILMPQGLNVSCAELTSEEKNAISHRGRAFRALLPHIIDALG